MTPEEQKRFDAYCRNHPWDIRVPEFDHKKPVGTVPNPYFGHKPKPAHPRVTHVDPSQIKPELHRAVQKQQKMRSIAHPKGKIIIPAASPQQRTDVRWIASVQQYMTGHVSIQPYTGEGTDYAIRFMQGVLDYREQHQLQIYHMYEIFCVGFGSIYVVMIEFLAQLLDGVERMHTTWNRSSSSSSSSPNKYELDGWMKAYLEWVRESNRQYDSYHL